MEKQMILRFSQIKKLSIIALLFMVCFSQKALSGTGTYGTLDSAPMTWSGDFGSGGDDTWAAFGDLHFSDSNSSCCSTRVVRTDSSFSPGAGDLEITFEFVCQETQLHSQPVGDVYFAWDPFPFEGNSSPDYPLAGFLMRKDHISREGVAMFQNARNGTQNGFDTQSMCGPVGTNRAHDFKILVKKQGGAFLFQSGPTGDKSAYEYKDLSAISRPFTVWYYYGEGGVVSFSGGGKEMAVVTNGSSPITITPTASTIYYNAANPPTISATISGAGTPNWRIDIIDSTEDSIRGVPATFDDSTFAYSGTYLQWTSGTNVSFAWDILNDAGGAASDGSYTARIAAIDEPNLEGQTQDVALIRDDTAPSASVSGLNTWYANSAFTVSWSGTDSQSGVACYDVQYRKDGGGWNLWQSCTAAVNASFTPSGAGVYEFEARAKDNVDNWETFSNSAEVSTTVDTTPPTTSVAALNTYYGPTTIPLTWSGTDNTQSGIATYTVKVRKDAGAWTEWIPSTSSTSGSYPHSGAGVYYFEVCARDNVGNAETCSGTSEANTTVELIGPVSTISALNPYFGPGTFNVSWSGTDTQGVSCYDVQYQKDGGGWNAWLTCTGLTTSAFTHSGAGVYEFEARGKDTIENWETFINAAEQTTTVELTPPTTSMTALNAYYGTGDIAVAWTGTDPAPDNGIACYDVEVQKDSGGWTLWQSCTASASANYTHSGDGVYEFRSRAKDGVGNWGTLSAAQIDTIVDATAPTSAVDTLPSYSTTTVIPVTWTGADPNVGANPGSGLNCYDIQVQKDSGGWTDWLTCTTATYGEYTHTGGGTYEFRSRATDAMGNVDSYPGTADASIIVDSSAPVFSFVNDGDGADETYTGSTTTLSANWSAADLESGVNHYEYAIGTFSGDTSILGWTALGTNTNVTNSSLTLAHGTTYFITVRAFNNSGYYSEQSSNGIKADHQPPTVSMSAPNAAYTGSLDFAVTWSATDGAGESGVQNYTVQYKDGAGAWTDWTPTQTTDTTRTFSGLHAHTYYFRVIAQDNMGNWSAYPTTPDYYKTTTVDTSQPSAPGNISDGATSGDDLDFIADAATFSGRWDAVSSTPGIQSYSYRIGTSAGLGDVVDWTETTDTFFTETGLSLTETQTYYITVKAKNLAGDFGYEGSSDGITIDLTSPTCAVASLWAFQGSESFSVSWSGADATAGIADYDVQYKLGAGGTWTDWLTATTLTSDLFPGADNSTYYFQCRARDNADLFTSYLNGDGDTFTTVDTYLPLAPATVSDSSGADIDYSSDLTAMSANWATVADSAGYKICFGKGELPNNCDVMPWTDNGASTSFATSGLSLSHGETYFARVLAYNFAGTQGAPGNSDGVLVDTAKPGTPAVTDDGDFFSTLHAQWTADPGLSGIIEYQVAVGATAGATDVLDWTTNDTNTEKTFSDLTGLAQGRTYYVSVKAKSSAGVWSDPGASDGITYDSVPPTCTVADLAAYQLTPTFSVSWSAADDVSGLAYLFTVQVRDGEHGAWTDWLTQTSSRSATYEGSHEHQYFFRCSAMDNINNWTEYTDGDGDTSTTMDIVSEVTYTYLPEILKTAPAQGQPATVTTEITFSERKGRTINYDQVTESFLLEGGTVIEKPVETTTLTVPGGAESKQDLTLTIPADTVTLALAGRISSVVTVRRAYTGLDDLSSPVALTVEIPVTVTTVVSDEAFEVSGLAIAGPGHNGAATGEFTASGVGQVNGLWILDGKPYRTFSYDITGRTTMKLELPLPSDLEGDHTLQLRTTMPEFLESDKITLSLSGAADAAQSLTAFQAGDVQVTDVQATFNPSFASWSGTGKLLVPVGSDSIRIDTPVPFSNIRVADKDGRKVLERGFLFADTAYTYEKDPFNIVFDRILVTADQAAADGRVTYKGSDDVPGVGPFFFYGAKIDKNGLEGNVSLSSPQKGRLGMFEFGIYQVEFSYGGSGVAVNAQGDLKTTPQPILNAALKIDVDNDSAFMVAELSGGAAIDLNGFKFEMTDGALVVENDALVFKGSGSLDLGAAFGNASVEVADARFYSSGQARLSGLGDVQIDLGIFKAKLDTSADIVVENAARKSVDAGLDLAVILETSIAGEPVAFNGAISATASGVRESGVRFNAGAAGPLFAKTSGGVALTLDSGRASVKANALEQAVFTGSLEINGASVQLDNVVLDSNGLRGATSAQGAAALTLGNFTLNMKGGLSFSWTGTGFALSAGETSIALDSLIPGASGELTLSSLEVTESGIKAETSARQEVEFKGTKLVISKAALEAQGTSATVTMSGAFEMSDPDIAIAFHDMTISSEGALGGDIVVSDEQSINMFGIGFALDSVSFDMTGDALALRTSGRASLAAGAEEIAFKDLLIAPGKVEGAFQVSAQTPGRIPWYPGLSVATMEIRDNVLILGGSLEFPDPISRSVGFSNLRITADGKAEASDGGMLILETAADATFSMAGFDFAVTRLAVPNPFAVKDQADVPDTLAVVDVESAADACGQSLGLKITGLELTSAGFRDVRKDIGGGAATPLYTKQFSDGSELALTGLVFSMVNGKVDALALRGALAFQGQTFEIPSLAINEQGSMQGALKISSGVSIDIDGVKIAVNGDAEVALDTSGSCEDAITVAFRDVSVDLSGPVGSNLKLKLPELVFQGGRLDTAVDLTAGIYLGGAKFDITEATITGSTGGNGEDAFFKASLDGSVSITEPSLKLAFEGLVISSDGEVGGDLVLYGAQEFVAYGATFAIEGLRVARPIATDAATTGGGKALAIYAQGALKFKEGSTMAFDKLMIAGGRLAGVIEVAEEAAAQAPWAENIGITKVEFRDNQMIASGFLDIPDPINAKLRVEDLAIHVGGHVSGGKVVFEGEPISIQAGEFAIELTGATYDIPTRMLDLSGSIRLPEEITDQAVAFTSMGIDLGKKGYAKIDTSRMQSALKYIYDRQHKFTIRIDDLAVGQEGEQWYVSMAGHIAMAVGAYVVDLECDRYTLYSNGTSDVQGVRGEIVIQRYILEIDNFSFNDQDSNPYIEMSGKLTVDGLGELQVESLKRYKDGNVSFEHVMVYFNYSALEFLFDLTYSFDAKRELERFTSLMEQGGDSLAKVWESDLDLAASAEELRNMVTSTYSAFAEEKLAIAATVFINGYGVAFEGYYTPEEWAIDADVCGLAAVLKIIPVCPVVVFDCFGGGFTYTFSGGLQGGGADYAADNSGGQLSSSEVTTLTHFLPDYLQVRLRTTMGIVNTSMVSISGQLGIDTQGVIEVDGDMTVLDMVDIGEVHLVFDPYNMSVSGEGVVRADTTGSTFPISAEKLGAAEFMFDADIGGSENQSNGMSDYGVWAYGAGRAAYEAMSGADDGSVSASNAGSMAAAGGVAAVKSQADTGLGDSTWGKLLTGNWQGSSLDWFIKYGYDISILGGLYTAYAQATINKDGFRVDAEVPFTVNISSDDVSGYTGINLDKIDVDLSALGIDYKQQGFVFDNISVGEANLAYGIRWGVNGPTFGNGYSLDLSTIDVNEIELFGELNVNVNVDFKVASFNEDLKLVWNNNSTIDDTSDDYFEGAMHVDAGYVKAIPFPFCSTHWRDCNCHTVKWKSCGKWSCKTKSKRVCASCPEFYNCPPDTFDLPMSFEKDLTIRLDKEGFHASFE